jgi:hypothetical protein
VIPTLEELITNKRDERGYSYGELETRAGNVISRQRWQQLGSGARVKEFSEPATIRAMATALDVEQSLVVLAMAKSIGLDVELGGAHSVLAQMLPASARNLTPEQRNAILAIVRVIGQSRSQQQQRVQPAPPIGAAPPAPAAVDRLALRRGQKAAQGDPDREALDEAITAHTEGRAAAREGESEGRRMRDAHDADAEAGDDIDPAAGEGHADQGDAPDGGA